MKQVTVKAVIEKTFNAEDQELMRKINNFRDFIEYIFQSTSDENMSVASFEYNFK